jgi:hypothetical protein
MRSEKLLKLLVLFLKQPFKHWVKCAVLNEGRYITAVCALVALCVYLRGFSTQHRSDEQIITSVMDYQMPDIITRCQKDFGYTDDDMVLLERELKRYLILCMVKENIDDTINMYSGDVDNLWHSFILFTKEYTAFCHENAQRFIHHSPRVNDTLTEAELLEARKDFKKFIEKYEKTFNEEIHPIWLLDRCSQRA